MDKRSAYQQKAEAALEEQKAALDKARAQVKGKTADAKLEAEKQLGHLEKQYDAAKAKLVEFRQAGEDAWEDLTDGLEHAWNDVASGFKKFFGA